MVHNFSLDIDFVVCINDNNNFPIFQEKIISIQRSYLFFKSLKILFHPRILSLVALNRITS